MDAVTCLESGAGLQVVFPLTPPLSRRRRGKNFVCHSLGLNWCFLV